MIFRRRESSSKGGQDLFSGRRCGKSRIKDNAYFSLGQKLILKLLTISSLDPHLN